MLLFSALCFLGRVWEFSFSTSTGLMFAIRKKKKDKTKFFKKKQVYFGFSFFSYPIETLIGVDLIWFKFWVWSVPFQNCPIYFIIVG